MPYAMAEAKTASKSGTGWSIGYRTIRCQKAPVAGNPAPSNVAETPILCSMNRVANFGNMAADVTADGHVRLAHLSCRRPFHIRAHRSHWGRFAGTRLGAGLVQSTDTYWRLQTCRSWISTCAPFSLCRKRLFVPSIQRILLRQSCEFALPNNLAGWCPRQCRFGCDRKVEGTHSASRHNSLDT